MSRYDIAIVGAGMAGAGLAAALAGEARVLLLEAEDRPGYHSTGRSAAFWSETYGGPMIQPLTSASRAALAPFLSPRGCIHLADADGVDALAALADEFAGSAVPLRPLSRPELETRLPGLRPGWEQGLAEPTCADIDVAALHASCLRAAGAGLVVNARLQAAERREGYWSIATTSGGFEAGILVNAAGAWADAVALLAGEKPLGITPYRRTIVQLRTDPPAPADLPLIVDALEHFYFKPEAGGRLWLSPHDETLSAPCDCAPEELDVAIAIDRLERVVDWRIAAVEHKWAGLRSFAPDRLPVYGFSDSSRGFFWCAGQGGFGIQTAPAASALAAGLLLGRPAGAIDPAPYSAVRFA
ncbi:MAG TPA: FAD-binding oxidoreductase [Allosphingosinicella sp.]|nr:FAD-binding oxidoreductase [Allosphingosinicella sp.]